MTGRILPRMPSYAHYYQTLIPHMLVPPGSIHLHMHSPSVLTSSLGLGNRPDQEVSESEAGAGHSLEKLLPNKLFHLERVSHRPDNLLLPTTVNSLTRREDIHHLSMSLL